MIDQIPLAEKEAATEVVARRDQLDRDRQACKETGSLSFLDEVARSRRERHFADREADIASVEERGKAGGRSLQDEVAGSDVNAAREQEHSAPKSPESVSQRSGGRTRGHRQYRRRQQKKKSGGFLRRSEFTAANIATVAGQSPVLRCSRSSLFRATRITLAALDRHNKRVTVVPAIGIAGVTGHGRGICDFRSFTLHIHLDQMFDEATNR